MKRRDDVPDIPRTADEILADLREDPGDTGQGALDAIATMTGLTPDDLIALVLNLGRRVIEAEQEDDER